jgi:hypothetical protein
MPKRGIYDLLLESALQPDLCRRLLESPDEVFATYELTVEQRELLRHPDHRLPDTLMALTVVPCALRENGLLKGISDVVWVNPLPEGADPASQPPTHYERAPLRG